MSIFFSLYDDSRLSKVNSDRRYCYNGKGILGKLLYSVRELGMYFERNGMLF